MSNTETVKVTELREQDVVRIEHKDFEGPGVNAEVVFVKVCPKMTKVTFLGMRGNYFGGRYINTTEYTRFKREVQL